MKKSNTPMPAAIVGLDLGDRFSHACFLDPSTGAELREVRLRTTRRDLERVFAAMPHLRIALEVGTHSPWVSRLLVSFGHQVLVANPREVRLVAYSRKKNDRFDARALARLARLDPALLAPIRHRGEAAQCHLATLRARAALVRSRTLLVNHLRGAVKSAGSRLPACSTERLHKVASQALPGELFPALEPIVALLANLTEQIHHYDQAVDKLAHQHPDTASLRQVNGVGTLTSLAYVLTLEEPARFTKSRASATRSSTSRAKETRSCASSSSNAPSTSSDPSAKTAICDDTGSHSPSAAARPPRSAPLSPSLESSPFCCIDSGALRLSTNHSGHTAKRRKPRRKTRYGRNCESKPGPGDCD